MMKISYPAVLLVLMPVALANSKIDNVCSGMLDVWNCKATFDIPTGAKVKNCRNKSFRTDSCKTRTKYKYPCPTWRKPGRTCDGWTCVPGTVETWIDVPCGITITTKKVDLCESVRGVLGNAGQQFITKSKAMCECLPKALDLVAKSAFDAVKSGTDVSAAVSKIIGDAVRLQKCMIDNGFDVKDNKAEVVAKDLSPSGDWVVVQAAEIDLATYGDLAVAISPCLVSACQPDLIRSFFTNYLTASNKVMSKTLGDVLQSWIVSFQKIENHVSAILDSIENLVTQAQAIPSRIKDIETRVCTDKACLESSVSEFMKKVAEAVEATQAFSDLQDGVRRAVEVAPQLAELTNSAIDLAQTIPDVDDLIQLGTSGKIRKIQDIVESFQIAKKFPEIVGKMQEAADPILRLVATSPDQVENALASLQELVSQPWENYLDSGASPVEAAQNGVLEIQNVLREDLELPLRNVTENMSMLDDIFDGIPIKKGQFKLQAGVSSYRRWSTVSMDLPCTRKKKAHYQVAGGFKGSFDYPEIYACPSGEIEVPWPNHHIPYFKFSVA